MSAIWGMIDLSGKMIEQTLPDVMGGCLHKYKIDKTNQLLEGNVFMACGLQFFTQESHDEILPISDNGVYFTADCVLDDRENLVRKLGAAAKSCNLAGLNSVILNGQTAITEDIPDGTLLYMAFRLWGKSFADHVVGLFSFACYDRNSGVVSIYTDHVSNRCIHYHVADKKVYFATLTSCITDAEPGIGLCDRWMKESQAVNMGYTFLQQGYTPFENVFILPYGTGVDIRLSDDKVAVSQHRYWDPLKTIKRDKHFDDDKCRKEFVQIFTDCVKDAIRSDAGIGVMLSSGLDSTSIASVAATYLAEKGQELRSFTSIPLQKFDTKEYDASNYYVDDESDGVLKLCERYPNIKPEFLSCEGKSVWSYMERWNDYLEMPGNAYVNQVWTQGVYDRMNEHGCKVLLEGFHGNYSISYGCREESMNRALREGHFITAYNLVADFARAVRRGRKKIVKCYLDVMKQTGVHSFDFFDDEALLPEILDEYDLKKLWTEQIRGLGTYVKTEEEYRNCLINPQYFTMVSVYNTKHGLANGLLIRDPSMDKRILEYCLRVHYLAFAVHGVERRLVREYLKDYVPYEIRMDWRHRGRQSADAAIRLNEFMFPDGSRPEDKISDVISCYYDMDAVRREIQKKTVQENLDWKIKVVSCSLFMSMYEKKRRQ